MDLILTGTLLVTFVLFPFCGYVCLRLAPAAVRMWLFAAINLLFCIPLCVLGGAKSLRLSQVASFTAVTSLIFAFYLALVLLQFVLVRRAGFTKRLWPAMAFPVGVLIFVKYLPSSWNPSQSLLANFGNKPVGLLFVGLSYMTFRLTQLAVEVRNGTARMPSLPEYLSFAFFVPTLSVGPINPWSTFVASLDRPDYSANLRLRAVLRIVVGLTKYLFLASVLNQLSYRALVLDGHRHHVLDVVIATLFYPLYLYCNFAGFCDMAIGVSGLLGLQVIENFENPLVSRNIQEFWNRWHISLSKYLRDVIFSPLSKALIRRFGPGSVNHVVAFSIVVVFLIAGIWHGAGWNFAIFGLSQGVGLATCHYYTVFLKQRLGKARYGAYMKNTGIRVAAVALNYCYFAGASFFFANSLPEIVKIVKACRQ